MSISISNLLKRYGDVAVVHGISFDVAEGEFVSLLGPSGCGKTTTLRCIAGLEDANGGIIRIGDEIVSDPSNGQMAPPHQREIGMVFQSYAIWPHMTVEENVGFPLSIRKIPKEVVRQQVEHALDIVGMLKLKGRQPSQLSGGQQQRIALARAIVGKPKVLLFDEPLSNLDAKLREGTRGEIKRLQRELNVAAVYVTHDQEEALSMSDRIIVMELGHIRQTGAPRELYRRPLNHFVADFVGKASFLEVTGSPGGNDWTMSDGTMIHVRESPKQSESGYQLMLRPEAVRFSERPAENSGSMNFLHGTIVASHYLGAFTEYHIETAGGGLKLHSGEDRALGAEVSLAFSPEDCQLIARLAS